MDVQFWIWLIVIILTFLVRARNKKQPVPESRRRPLGSQPEDSAEDRTTTDPKPMSFEELLREIQASKTPEPARTIRQEPTPSYEVDYDDNLEEVVEEKSYEREVVPEEKTYEIYEKAKQQAFHRPSLEETLKLEDTVVKFTHFKGYQSEEKAPVSEFLKEFKDPKGFKRAFIMSEILKRKF